MPAKRRSKVLCQKAVPYQLYKGLAFTTIWLGSKSSQKKMLGGSAKCRAFLNFIMKIKGVAENIDENSC